MGVRHTWRTKSPKIQFLFVFFSFVRHKNVMVGRSQALLVEHKSHCDCPKVFVIAQPFHALCWTNAVQWRGRCFNYAIGSAPQCANFKQIVFLSRIFQSCNVRKSSPLHCVVEHQYHSWGDRRHPDDSGNSIWHCFHLLMIIFGVYLIVLMYGTVNLILMTILYHWFEFSPQHGQSQCFTTHYTWAGLFG